MLHYNIIQTSSSELASNWPNILATAHYCDSALAKTFIVIRSRIWYYTVLVIAVCRLICYPIYSYASRYRGLWNVYDHGIRYTMIAVHTLQVSGVDIICVYIIRSYTLSIGRYTLYRHGATTQSYTKRNHRTHCRPSRVLLLMLMIFTM